MFRRIFPIDKLLLYKLNQYQNFAVKSGYLDQTTLLETVGENELICYERMQNQSEDRVRLNFFSLKSHAPLWYCSQQGRA